MPETETPARRVMRQWYQGKLGERLLQAAQMAKDRALLRRGAIKQQNGTLGHPDDTLDAWDDSMEIRVGDEIHNHYGEPSSSPAASAPVEASTSGAPRRSSWLLPAALAVGSALAGAAGPGGLLVYQTIKAAANPEPAPVVQQAAANANTLYEFHLSKGE